MIYSSLLSLLLLGSLGGEVTLSAHDGELFTRARKIRVTAETDKPITQVEFYMGGDLRDSDTSTPYEFMIDPLAENEGEVTLKFVVYTEDGEAGSKTVTIRLDAGVSKGAAFNVQEALNYVIDSKWDDAILSARVALKADPENVPARIVMARAYLGKNVLDKAQQLTEDALKRDANNAEAKDLLIYVRLRNAYAPPPAGTDKRAAFAAMNKAIQAAVAARNQALVGALDSMGAPTDENRIAYADAAIRSERFSLAVNALSLPFRQDPSPALGNRLAFAQARSGRFSDALRTLQLAETANKMDGYSYALRAMILGSLADFIGAEDALREAVLRDGDSTPVRLSQLWVAMVRGTVQNVASLAQNAVSSSGGSPETFYYLGVLQSKLGRQGDAASSFRQGIMLEPGIHDLFLEQANQAMAPFFTRTPPTGAAATEGLATAEMYLKAATTIRPDSPDVLASWCFLSHLRAKPNDTLNFARATVNASSDYAPGQFIVSSVCSYSEALVRKNIAEALTGGIDRLVSADEQAQIDRMRADRLALSKLGTEALKAAGRLDRRLTGRHTPDIDEAFNFYHGYGRLALLPMPR